MALTHFNQKGKDKEHFFNKKESSQTFRLKVRDDSFFCNQLDMFDNYSVVNLSLVDNSYEQMLDEKLDFISFLEFIELFLNRKQFLLVKLYSEGVSNSDIAIALGVSINIFYTLRKRTFTKIRKIIKLNKDNRIVDFLSHRF